MKNNFKFEIPLFTDEKCDKLFQIIINFNQRILDLIKQEEELKQALEEIREIAQFACDKSICRKDCKMCSDGRILDTINKVLESEVENE